MKSSDGIKRKRSHSTFIAIVCLVASGLSSLNADGILRGRPISFYGLKNNEVISFSVYTNKPPASFDVEVRTQPKPQAKILLNITSSIQIVNSEKSWGRAAGVPVFRSLTTSDLRSLQEFLDDFKAREAVPRSELGKVSTMRFERDALQKNKEGNLQSGPDQVEFYRTSEQAQQEFITNFIGFKN